MDTILFTDYKTTLRRKKLFIEGLRNKNMLLYVQFPHKIEGPYLEYSSPLSLKCTLSGSSQFYTHHGRQQTTVDPQHYLIVNKDTPFISHTRPQAGEEIFNIFFADDLMQQAWTANAFSDAYLLDNPGYLTIAQQGFHEQSFHYTQHLTKLLHSLKHHMLTTSKPNLQTENMLYLITQELFKEHCYLLTIRSRLPATRKSTKTELAKRLRLAKDLIENTYTQPLCLAQLAQVACLSKYHFLRQFKAAFHATPHQYVLQCRITKAQELLKSTHLPITEIAYQLGFADVHAFSRSFRNMIKVSPTVYRTF